MKSIYCRTDGEIPANFIEKKYADLEEGELEKYLNFRLVRLMDSVWQADGQKYYVITSTHNYSRHSNCDQLAWRKDRFAGCRDDTTVSEAILLIRP